MNSVSTRARHSLAALAAALLLAGCGRDAPPFTPPPAGGTLACVDYRAYLHTAGVLTTGGDALGVTAAGDRVFVANATVGVLAVDASDPYAPRALAAVDTTGTVRAVAVRGTTVFAAYGTSGLVAADFTDPNTPRIIGAVDMPGEARDVVLDPEAPLAYVANDVAGLVIVDVSDPAAPAIVGIENTPGSARAVAVSGPVAYVADADLGLRVVSVAAPADPFLVRAVATPGDARGVAVIGSSVLVADGAAGLTVVDAASPAAAAVAGNLDTPGTAEDVAAGPAGLAFLADGAGGVRLVDVRDPTHPALGAVAGSEGNAAGLAWSDGRLIVADRSTGLRVVAVPAALGARGARSVPTSGAAPGGAAGASPVAIAADSALVCVADTTSGVSLMEPGDPLALRSAVALPGTAVNACLRGDRLYVAAGSGGVQVVDVGDPDRPIVLGRLPGSDGAVDVTVVDTLAVVARSGGSVLVLDLKHGTEQGVGLGGAPVLSAVVAGDRYSYIAGGDRVYLVYDNPALPLARGSLTVPGRASDLVIHPGPFGFGGLLYVAVSSGVLDTSTGSRSSAGVDVLDLSNESIPSEIAFVATVVAARRIALAGNLLIVAGGSGGMEVLDVADPTSPVRLGTVTPGPSVADAALLGNVILVAAGDDGLRTFPAPCLRVGP